MAEARSDYAAPSYALADAETDPPAQPVTQKERIPTIDVVRGVALMGILLMNIAGFSGPLEMYTNPLMVGNHRTYNLVAWLIRWILFEGKMRAMFSMLFGAGVILLTERAERRGSRNIADIFLRRNMWLALFGIVHCYLIWIGDILYWYGITALLFLYPCRKVRPRNLLIAGLLVLVGGMGSDAYQAIDGNRTRDAGLAAQALVSSGKKLTTDQQDALKKWNDTVDRRKKEHDDDLKAMRGSYLEQLKMRAGVVPKLEADFYYMFGFTDVLGMMLIGMALYRTGFLTGALSSRVYGWAIATGYLLSIPLNGFEAWGVIRDNFQPESNWWMLYQLGRIPGAIANVALVVLVAKSGVASWLMRRIAAVGQTALSNYLFTSISCSLLFNGFGLGYYGRLEYYQLYAIVLCVWALNLILSSLWLRHFQFGPMEWVWRSLTYWKRQPMRRKLAEPEAVAA
ncbi:MAG TPA: DUF418 domain-containing protein [Terracidiphilus sp.]|nr:DUF418 domain-containing protein [Terracidiphilus sp.]